MNGKRNFGRATLCLAQTALLIFGNAGAAFAAADLSQLMMQQPQVDKVPVKQAPVVVSKDYGEEPKSPAADLLQDAMEKFSNGDLSGAERTFKRVLTIDKNNPDAYFNLGVLYEGQGNLQLALENYTKAHSLNPGDAELKETVQAMRSKIAQETSTKVAQAQQANEAKQAQNRETLRQMVSSASSDYKNGNFSEAVRKLEKVAVDAPADPDVQYALGQAYKAKGDTERARTAFNRAMSIDPSSQLYRNAVNELSNTQLASAPQVDNTPPGQITPFSDSGNSYGESFGSSSRGGFFDGGITRSYSSGSRLKRAAVGSAMGAAAGALFAASTRGGMKRGAIQGALLGGVLGYFGGR